MKTLMMMLLLLPKNKVNKGEDMKEGKEEGHMDITMILRPCATCVVVRFCEVAQLRV